MIEIFAKIWYYKLLGSKVIILFLMGCPLKAISMTFRVHLIKRLFVPDEIRQYEVGGVRWMPS